MFEKIEFHGFFHVFGYDNGSIIVSIKLQVSNFQGYTMNNMIKTQSVVVYRKTKGKMNKICLKHVIFRPYFFFLLMIKEVTDIEFMKIKNICFYFRFKC